MVLKNMKSSKNLPENSLFIVSSFMKTINENYGFFKDENSRFFKVFEITKTSNSLILKFLHRTGTSHSLQIHRTSQQHWFEPVMNGRVIK